VIDMSVAGGVVLCRARCETKEGGGVILLERIDAWLAERGSFKLERAEQSFGSTKHPICLSPAVASTISRKTISLGLRWHSQGVILKASRS